MADTKIIIAKLKYLHIAPRKTQMVANLVRGLPLDQAYAQLMINSRRPSKAILKLLKSAEANARNNFHLTKENFYVKEIRVDQGPRLKRYMPRARGNINKIEKKMSHITVVLDILKDKKPQFQFLPKTKKTSKKTEKEQKEETKKQQEQFKGKQIKNKEISLEESANKKVKKSIFNRKAI
ncbi:MAG: 50S ribosomal protein L22 [Minisyncoccia bacterium]